MIGNRIIFQFYRLLLVNIFFKSFEPKPLHQMLLAASLEGDEP